jgi:hypothetical protein
MTQTTIDLEDLYSMLKTDPVVKEKIDAKELFSKMVILNLKILLSSIIMWMKLNRIVENRI